VYTECMNTAVINIKTDRKTKSEAQKLADEMGLTLTAVINRYLKHFVKTKSVTFNANDEEPNDFLLNTMKKSDNQLKSDDTSPTFDNAEDAIEWLHKQTKSK
jgi:addiction module RelB/DinJ family antitoxin